ncbi:MAG: 5'-nucleotidase C-terminal domain-containing protein [Candidatus Obscuribacterales bacterium]|nr:5'-nucleotidase C-terminal domain-containing protein [Candidatus Obscuribacterales bacterium]
MPERGNFELSNDRNGHGSFESSSRLAQEASAANTPFWETTGFKQGSSEAVGTFAAGLTGILTFSAGAAMKRYQLLKAGTVALAPVLGGWSKHGVKEGLDSMLHLSGKDKSASTNDYYTGALDAVAGITGSMAEQKASHWYTGYVGRRELTRGSTSAAGGLKHEFASWIKGKSPTGMVSEKAALTEGKRIVSQDVLPQITHNVLRGVAGGFVGSLTWSVPHRAWENRDEINKDATQGTIKTISQIGVDTTLGTLIGGGSAGLITSAIHGKTIGRYFKAHLNGDDGLTRMDVSYFNDGHGQMLGDRNFARANTLMNDLGTKSKTMETNSPIWSEVPEKERTGRWWKQFTGQEPVMENQRTARNYQKRQGGDLENANVSAPWTGWGKGEDEIVRAMDLDVEGWGNHPFDKAGGGSDIVTLPEYINQQNTITGKRRPIVTSNLDLSELPEEAAKNLREIFEPYIVHELKGPNGKPVKAATIGLTTEEGAVGGIKYIDAAKRLKEVLAQVKEEHPDTKIFMVQAHLGDEITRKLAQEFKEVSVIFDAHSHQAYGTVMYVNNGERDVAIIQAGAYLSHIGEYNLAFNPDGSLNKFRTTGRLHAVTKDIKEDPVIKSIIDKRIPKELNDLYAEKYDATATAKYNLDSIRRDENPTANLIVDALVADSQKRIAPDIRPDIITAQSGFIRTGIPGGQELSRFDLCKVIINAGKKSDEELEQVMVNVTGKQFKDMLEFGIADLNAPQDAGIKGFIKQMFNRMLTGKSMPKVDDPQGNLLHMNGSYTFDLSKPVGQRVSKIMLNENGHLAEIEPTRTYRWQTRWHFIDKAHKAGLLGDVPLKDAYKAIDATDYKESIVDAIGDYIRGKILDPKIHGKVEGRIINKTPQPFSLQYGPGPSIPTFSVLSGRDTMSGDQKAH